LPNAVPAAAPAAAAAAATTGCARVQMSQRRSVATWDDTWRIEMKCVFPGPRQLRVAVLVTTRPYCIIAAH